MQVAAVPKQYSIKMIVVLLSVAIATLGIYTLRTLPSTPPQDMSLTGYDQQATMSAEQHGSGQVASPTADQQAASGKVYYVASDGNDANPGTNAQPFRTLVRGAGVLQPGDTLLVKPGVYTDSLVNKIPSGTDWNKPITIKSADPEKRPTLAPPNGAQWVLHFGKYNGSPVHHIIVDGFILDAQNVLYDGTKITDGAHHIRLANSEVKNSRQMGVLVTLKGSDFNEFVNLDVHNNGDDAQLEHGLYISTSNNLVQDCAVYDNAAYGVHLYSGYADYQPNNNRVINNRVYNQAGKGGIVVAGGSNNQVYNNIVWNNARGVDIQGAATTKVYNNTIYNNSQEGVYVGSNSTATRVVNNISSSNNLSGILNNTPGDTLISNNILYRNDLSSTNNADNNILNLAGASAVITGNLVNVDPRFVDPANARFRLKSDSPAIDAGLSLSEVREDFSHFPRPSGAPYEIGAYEFTFDTTVPLAAKQ